MILVFSLKVDDANQMNLRIIVSQIAQYSDRLSVRENGSAVSWKKILHRKKLRVKYGCQIRVRIGG